MRRDLNGKLDGDGIKRGELSTSIAGAIAPIVINRAPKANYLTEIKLKLSHQCSYLRSAFALYSIEISRTPQLGKVSNTSELLKINGVPGRQGVILEQKLIKVADIWELSNRNGIEYVLSKENGRFILRSGALDRVAVPKDVRPIFHTHPPDSLGRFSKLPSRADINVLNRIWEINPNGTRPASFIVWGRSPLQTTLFYATSPFDVLK